MKTLRFFIAFLLLYSWPFCALAMDMSLIGDSAKGKWLNDIESQYIQPDDSLNGYGLYYSDVEKNCFYLYLSYHENSIKNNGDNSIYLDFNIKNSIHNYHFCVDKNGFIDSTKYTDKDAIDAFYVLPDFGNASTQGQEIYIGIEFKNKDDKKLNNTLRVSLNVNNTAYNVSNNIQLKYGDYAASQTTTKPTTTKASTTKVTTTKATTSKPTTESTTKFKPTESNLGRPISLDEETLATEKHSATNGGSTEKTTAQKTEPTTKFKYSVPATIPSSQGNTYDPPINNDPTENDQQEETATVPWEHSQTTKAEPAQTQAPTKFTYTQGGQTQSNQTQNDHVQDDQNQGGSAQEFSEKDDQLQSSQTENAVIIPETENAESFSPQAKLLTAAAVILAVSGTALIIRSLLKKEKQNEEEK